jgi:hypothetical protein
MNITIEERNAQKLFNLLNVANLNVQNRDIYCYLKNYVKTTINSFKLSPKDREILIGHINAFNNELSQSPWDIRQFDPNKYDAFLNDFYKKVNFNKIDVQFMFKCKDILEVSPVKNDLYRRRMEFLDKKLPKISPGTNNVLNKTQMQNNNTSINMNKNMNLNKMNAPVNPFAGINNQNSSPYNNYNNGPYNMGGQSPYQQINNTSNNNDVKTMLRGQPPTKSINQINNINNNLNNANTLNNNNLNNVNNMYNFENKKKIIPEDIKKKIINELNKVSEDIVNGKIASCRSHSVEALILFKQIFPDQ